MKVEDLVNTLGLEVISGVSYLDREVKGGYCSDLLSDVMGNAREGDIWITLQVHKNIIAVASLKECSAILLVKGLKCQSDVLELSENENIPILSSSLSAFELSGKVYHLLMNE
jgi:serine kinase of HPr protein (carbohydrate metabolism regulator)